MENQRLLIWAFFGLMVWMTYTTWLQQYGPQPAAVSQVASEASDDSVPGSPAIPEDADDLPVLNDTLPEAPAPAPALDAAPVSAEPRAATVRVSTDVLELEISTRGGTIQSATLLNYPLAKDRPDELVQLFSTDEFNYGAIQTGIRTAGADKDTAEPTHQALFSAQQSQYALGSNDELIVPLRWTGDDGLVVEKRFRFTRGSYEITIEQELRNTEQCCLERS